MTFTRSSEFKGKKSFVKKIVFKEIKKWMNNDISDSLITVMDESFERQYPNDFSEFNILRKDVEERIKILRENSASESKNLDDPCKSCIEKMVNELYDLYPRVGMGNQLGQYMSRIWQFCEVVEQVTSLDRTQLKKISEIYNLREFYKTSYEFTIKFFIEFAYQIALEKEKNNDISSKTFTKKYRKNAAKGEKPLNRDLIVFLREQKYLDKGTCSFLQNSVIRNNICHENVYFDERTEMITFGKIKMSIGDFMKYFEEMYMINQYLISQNFERTAKEMPKL